MLRASLMVLVLAAGLDAAAAEAPAAAEAAAADAEGPLSEAETERRRFMNFEPWAGNINLGVKLKSGNTESNEADFTYQASRNYGLWDVHLRASADYDSVSSIITEEDLDARFQMDRSLTEVDYLYGSIDWERDPFADIDQKWTETVGYGRRLYRDLDQRLRFEVGPLAIQTNRSSGLDETEGGVRLRLLYDWDLREGLSFQSINRWDIAGDNGKVESINALTLTLTERLNLRVSVEIDYVDSVPFGTDHTDFETVLSLGYNF